MPRTRQLLTDARARLGLVLLVGALLLAAACAAPPRAPGGAGSGGNQPTAVEGAPAPGFHFISFDGKPVALADFAGRGVVLNFWASWCVPCRAEMPFFEKVARSPEAKGVAFIGLALLDDEPSSRAFLNEVGVTYPTGPDPNNEIARSYQVVGLPTTIFIRPDGTVARKWAGPISEEQLQEFLRDIS